MHSLWKERFSANALALQLSFEIYNIKINIGLFLTGRHKHIFYQKKTLPKKCAFQPDIVILALLLL
jgi:hypothetical protein